MLQRPAALFCTLSLEIDNYSIEEANLRRPAVPAEKEMNVALHVCNFLKEASPL